MGYRDDTMIESHCGEGGLPHPKASLPEAQKALLAQGGVAYYMLIFKCSYCENGTSSQFLQKRGRQPVPAACCVTPQVPHAFSTRPPWL